MTAAHQNGLKFLEDMVSVFLCNLIIFLLHRTSEATVKQIFSVMLSPFSQLCLNSFLGLEGNSVYLLRRRAEISTLQCVLGLHSLLYVSFTSAETWSLPMTHLNAYRIINEEMQ